MSNTQVITIDTITIRQDADGRYCLNDLHKAAGGNPNHQPAFFMRRDETKALVDAIYSANPQIIPWLAQRGFNGGTFVVRPLVFAYAMWVSPAFHLKVIEAYDRLQTQGVAVADHAAADLLKNPLKYLEAIIGQAKELQAQLEIAQPKAAVFDAVIADKRVTVAAFARTLEGVNTNKVKQALMAHGYLYKDHANRTRVYAKYRDSYFEEKINEYGQFDIYVKDKGKQLLVSMYEDDLLPFKVGYLR